MNSYELVCGFETHIELSSKTKIFCSCSSEFGLEPNTSCCPVCAGLPGALPVLNEKVLKYAIMMGLALGSSVNENSKLERKSYVYPDLPKAYQISQNSNPICTGGSVILSNGRTIRIHHLHIEEDAGKTVYKNGQYYVDYNRSGIPLIEIVSEPDIRTVDEAKEYIEFLRSTAKYLNISNGRMQEGSLRCDVNVSVKKRDSNVLGTRVEVKNMNSIKFICKAIEYEFARQSEILNKNEKVLQETRKFVEADGSTESTREKESVVDYKYFIEPDLRNIILDKKNIENIKINMPQLFLQKLNKYESLGIPSNVSKLICNYVEVSAFFDEIIKICTEKNIISAANFIVGPMFSFFETENEKEEFNINFSAKEFAYFIDLVTKGEINQNNAKKIIFKSLKENENLEKNSRKFVTSNNDFDLNSICKEVIINNQKAIADYKNGKVKAFQSLLGAVMKLSKGKADCEESKKILKELIK